MGEGHDPYAALRSPGYCFLLTGNVLSAFALEMLSVAVGWELYERTGSLAALGLVGLVQSIPVLILSLPAGQIADRFSRKRIYLLAQMLLAASCAVLAVLSFEKGPVAFVYVALTVVGIGRSFSAPSRWALLAQLVPQGALGNAVTWNSSGWQVASLLGPMAGGAALAFGGRAAWVYLLAAGICVTAGMLVALTRPRPVERPAAPTSVDSFLAGARFVWNSPLILATITLDMFAVLLGGATALLPVYAKDILGIGPTGFGVLRAAPAIGALVMALVLAHRPPLKRAGRTLLASVAGFGLATIGFGLSRDPVLSFLLLALTGALDNISIVVRGTLVQTLTPDDMRGRVTAVTMIFVVSSNELGAFESGTAAELFANAGLNGPVASVVSGGIGALLVVAWVMLKWPAVARLGSLHTPAAQPSTLPLGASSQSETADDEATRLA